MKNSIEYKPMDVNIHDERIKQRIINTIERIIDRDSYDMGVMFLFELLSLERNYKYEKLQHLVDLKRMFSVLSVNNISSLLVAQLSDVDLDKLKEVL